jgi:transcription elongation factor GreA-like protein
MQIGKLHFLDVKSATNTHSGDIVIHSEWGVGDVVGHRNGSVLVNFYDSTEDDGPVTLEVSPSELGFVKSIN